ncbi:MAG TPA: hypothetical protein VLG47_07970 [Candidatus Saccharimonadales bacterium]|nr:hypothetical protein [Candidatus Saccharimonadales bacterium]
MDETKDAKFAVIDPNSINTDGDKLVSWYSAKDFIGTVENVPNFRYVTTQDLAYKEKRIVDSNQHTWVLLTEFFTWPSGAIKPSAMCEFEGSKQNEFIKPFIDTHIGKHGHFVFEMGGKHVLANPKQIEKVRFITGHCLFSNRHLLATSNDGSPVDILNPRVALKKPIAKIEIDDGLSFYELEASLRLSRFLTDVAASLPKNIPFEIRLDVPFVQYYFYLIDAYWRKMISKELLFYWFDVIEKRHMLSVQRMKRQIVYWFSKSGLGTPDFVVDDGMQSVKEIVKSHINGAQTFGPKEIATSLEAHDPAWKTMNRLVNQNSFLDIVYASYSIEQLRANIDSLQDGTSPNTLTISIDNREESPTFVSSDRMLPKIKQLKNAQSLPIMDVYPLEHFFIANIRNWALYANDPGNLFFDKSGQKYTVEDLLMKVYGVQMDVIMNKKISDRAF